MADLPRSPLPFTPPTPDEARALRAAGNYLLRAGAQSSHLLLADPSEDANRLATVSDGLLAGAMLCAKVIEAARHQRDW